MVGLVLPPEWYFVLSQHYQPTGKPETDQSELGLWFHDEPVSTDVRETVASDGLAIVGSTEIIAEVGPAAASRAEHPAVRRRLEDRYHEGVP